MKRGISNFAAVFLLLMLVLPSPARSAGNVFVEYDRKYDALTVEAVETNIEDVLSEIAYRAGLRILIDPEVKKNVTINLKEVTLESGLHQIARGLSYALFFESGTAGQRLTGMRLVPKGKAGSEPLKELGRAAYRQPSEAASYIVDGAVGDLDYGTGVPAPARSPRAKPARDRVDDFSAGAGDSPVDADIPGDKGSPVESSTTSDSNGGQAAPLDSEASNVGATQTGGGTPEDAGEVAGFDHGAEVPDNDYDLPPSPNPAMGMPGPDATDPQNH